MCWGGLCGGLGRRKKESLKNDSSPTVFLRMGSLVLLAVYGNLTLVTPVVSVSHPQFFLMIVHLEVGELEGIQV